MDNKTFVKRILCWVIPVAVGGLATLLSGGMASYRVINQPPLSPPGWLFPIVWTALYLLMGFQLCFCPRAGCASARSMQGNGQNSVRSQIRGGRRSQRGR